MRTPVALIIFRRPDLTARVFEAIARARPEKLLIIADGPRSGHDGEFEECAATRAVVERIDWPCDVRRNYSDVNMGCGHRPATGLRWVFDQVEEAIILEDDCLPHDTFFRFCEELLDRFRNDERVMHISGDNFVPEGADSAFDYSFSCYPVSWGWATWRRAFVHYDADVMLWPILKNTRWLHELLVNPEAIAYWTKVFDLAHAEGDRAGYWDYQWLFACWAHRGLSILPRVNLVSNIGYEPRATHTKWSEDRRSNLPTAEIRTPLRHPPYMIRDRAVDDLIFARVVRPRATLYQSARARLASAVPAPLRKSVRALKSLISAGVLSTE